MRQYIGLIHKDADSEYGVSFPDFPGCITAGATLEEARRMAEEALALHVRGLAEDGEALPEPSHLDDVMRDPENRDGVVIVVPLANQAVRTVRVNITLPEDALQEIDAYAAREGSTRSGFLLKAARRAMLPPETFKRGDLLAQTILGAREYAGGLDLYRLVRDQVANTPNNRLPDLGFGLEELNARHRLPDLNQGLQELEAKIRAMDATMTNLRRAAAESLAFTELRVLHEEADDDDPRPRTKHG